MVDRFEDGRCEREQHRYAGHRQRHCYVEAPDGTGSCTDRLHDAELWDLLIGISFGLIAAAAPIGVSIAALAERGLEVRLNGGDYALLIGGSAVGAALWAAIGVGLGALVRNQVPTVVGICTWLLFVEGLPFGDIGLGDYGRFLPGSLAKVASGQDPQTLVAPGLAVLLLALYAAAPAAVGWVATTRRDVT